MTRDLWPLHYSIGEFLLRLGKSVWGQEMKMTLLGFTVSLEKHTFD